MGSNETLLKRQPSLRIDSNKLRTDLVEFGIFRPVSSRGTDVIGWIRKIGTDSVKRRGWFDHVWNAELNWTSGLKTKIVTARVLDATKLKADERRVRIP